MQVVSFVFVTTQDVVSVLFYLESVFLCNYLKPDTDINNT